MDDIQDSCAGKLKAYGYLLPVDICLKLHLMRQCLDPYFMPLISLWHWKLDDRLKSTGKSFINIASAVGGQNDKAVVAFNTLLEIGNFLIGILVVRIMDFCPLAEKCVGFIKEQNPVFVFSFVEKS